MKLDKIDKKLINILSKNGRMPLNQLAKEAFLSSPAVSSRMEKLEKAGIITGYQANINYQKLGFDIIAYINLQMTPQQKANFYPFIKNSKSVLECHSITGEFTVLIKVAFMYMPELDAFVNELQQFGRTNTQIVFSTQVEVSGFQIEEFLPQI